MDVPFLGSSHISVIWIHECAMCPFSLVNIQDLCVGPRPSLFPAQVL